MLSCKYDIFFYICTLDLILIMIMNMKLNEFLVASFISSTCIRHDSNLEKEVEDNFN